jgi:hypothetical protein
MVAQKNPDTGDSGKSTKTDATKKTDKEETQAQGKQSDATEWRGWAASNSRPNGVSWPLVGHDGPSGGLSIGFHGSRAKVGKIGCAQESTA